MKRKWITVELKAHAGNRRIGRLQELRVEPGRKFLLGQPASVRGYAMKVVGFGYELGLPVIHLRKYARSAAA